MLYLAKDVATIFPCLREVGKMAVVPISQLDLKLPHLPGGSATTNQMGHILCVLSSWHAPKPTLINQSTQERR